MDNTTLVGTLLIAIGTLATILTPILKISSKLTHMSDSIDHMLENDKVRDERIRTHGQELDDIRKQVAEHEVRITNLERYHHNQ